MSRAEYFRAYRAARKQLGRTVARGGRNKTAFTDAPFIAWDGEGFDIEEQSGLPRKEWLAAVEIRAHELRGSVKSLTQARELAARELDHLRPRYGRHVYTLFANSTGQYIENAGGLSTTAIFQFMLNESKRIGKAIHVGFATSYDANMMFGDLERDQLETLWTSPKHRSIAHKDHFFRVLYRQRKSLYLAKHDFPLFVNGRANVDSSMTLWDVFGFFQSSFVKACEQYLTDDERVAFSLDTIAEMKLKRSQFTSDDRDEIRAYCFKELDALVAVMNRLRDYLREAQLQVKRWDGSGAIAAALLEREGVKATKTPTPVALREAFASAYSGGRIEIAKLGRTDDTVYDYDLRSAYPAAMVNLPALVGGSWSRTTSPRGFYCARVRWHFPGDLPWYPLFYRNSHGSIKYPSQGEGWYWAPEVEAAIAFADALGGHVELLDAHQFTPGSEVLPFAFVRELYDRRAQWKRDGVGAEKVLKLAINSLYGKLAQQVGGEADREPPYFQMEWAGYITSSTRAALVMAALPHPEAVVMFATDGVFSTKPLPVRLADELGAWEETQAASLVVAQAGVYWFHCGSCKEHPQGAWHHRSRGFDLHTMQNPAIALDTWKRKLTEVVVPTTRFVTLGSALAGDEAWQQWRRWVEVPRRLDLSGTSEKRFYDRQRARWQPHRKLVTLAPRHNIEYEATGAVSAPYPVRFWGGDRVNDDPEAVLAQELEELYL